MRVKAHRAKIYAVATILLCAFGRSSVLAVSTTDVRSEQGVDVRIGTSILADQSEFCLIPVTSVGEEPGSYIAFPLDNFDRQSEVDGELVATVYRTKEGVHAVVHTPPGVGNEHSAVLVISRFITNRFEPCPDPTLAVRASFGMEGLSIVTEEGVVVDLEYKRPKD